MKPACESCAVALTFDSEAYVCSYECTFCPECRARLKSICPNCSGELVKRPRRALEPKTTLA
jgi:hypothetical protein